MKAFLQEYGMFIVYALIGLMLIGTIYFFSLRSDDLKGAVPKVENVSVGDNKELSLKPMPTLEVKSSVLKKGTAFNPLDYVIKAEDGDGNDIKDRVEVYDAEKVDMAKKGSYVVTYVLKDANGLQTRIEASFIVD